MVELTVGVASALIAAGIAVLQFLLPNALALVLTGNLSETHSAVTWSVVSRFLLSSDWPLFIRSESTSTTSVPRKLALITWMKPVGLLLAAIAAVVTPLGLHDGISPSSDARNVLFVYAPDVGPIGTGSLGPSGLGFSRICAKMYCPGEPELGNVSLSTTLFNGSVRYDDWSVRSPWISAPLIDLYQSGLKDNTTMAGFFDIQLRQWDISTNNYTAHNSSFLVPGPFKPLKSLILDNKLEILDGVIADMVSGGIGFRNHSVPIGLQYGAEWEEDILYWEPETECVNLNITLGWDATSDAYTYSSFKWQGLVDHGGFFNINRTSPHAINLSDHKDYPWSDSQSNPALYDRAYFTAWALNVLNMQYLNITAPPSNNSFPDTHKPLQEIWSSNGQRFEVNSSLLAASSMIPAINQDKTLYMLTKVPFDFSWNDTYNNPRVVNPYNMTSGIYQDLQLYVQNLENDAELDSAKIANLVGIAAAPGYQVGGQPTNDVTARGSKWEKPVYVCAAATKVSIKTFRFRYNASTTNDLSGLFVVDFKDKDYTESNKPIWALEVPSPSVNISALNPLWGFVDEAHANSPNMSTIQSDHLYIPASQDAQTMTSSGSYLSDYVPAITAPSWLWSSTFGSGVGTGFDYTGADNLLIRQMFEDLCQNSTGMALALKLIWTDIAANLLTSTKGIHTSRFQQPPAPTDSANPQRRFVGETNSANTYPVYILQRRIEYHWIYAIPAMICVGIVGLACFMALAAMMCGHGTVTRLRYFMFSITSGRTFASYMYPDTREDQQADTKEWIKVVGHKPIQLSCQSSGVDYGQNVGERDKLKYVQVTQREDTDTISSTSR